MYKKLHSAHTNHPITFDDGSSSTRYCRYEKGVVSGEYRDIQALIADEGGFDGLGFDASAGSNDDSWRVLNIFKDGGRYVDTVVIAGAMDDDHALTIADTQFDHLGGDYSVVVALDADHQFDNLNNQGDVWSIDAIQKLASNPSQDKHYLPVITAQELAVEATRATFDSVAWDGESLSSHGGDDSRLYIDLVKADTFNDLVGEFNLRDELVSIGAETTSFDSLMDTNNRLPLLKDRLYRAMVRAGSGEVQVTNVTQTKPFKRQGVSNVAFVFDLSDGQKLSIWFHNPDSTPTKLMPSDIMISWKWLLNKRDVTAVLSPKNGDNVQLPMLASRIMRLANKNSKRFKRTQASRLKTEAELQKAQESVVTKTAVIEQLDKDIASLQGQIDQALVTAKEKAEAAAKAINSEGTTDTETPKKPTANQLKEAAISYTSTQKNNYMEGGLDYREIDNVTAGEFAKKFKFVVGNEALSKQLLDLTKANSVFDARHYFKGGLEQFEGVFVQEQEGPQQGHKYKFTEEGRSLALQLLRLADSQDKPVMDLEPLDHGVLSMPNRTNNIDKELDKYNEQKAKDDRRKLDDIKFVNGERIAQEKADMQPVKEKAWEDYKKYGTAMIKKHGAMLPFKLGDGYNNNLNPRDFLKELAKYEPKRFLEVLDWHLKGGEFESPAEPAEPNLTDEDVDAIALELDENYSTENDFWNLSASAVQKLKDEQFEKLSSGLDNANFYSEDALFRAKRTGSNELIKEATDILEKHGIEGSMSPDLLARRSKLSRKIEALLKEMAKASAGEESTEPAATESAYNQEDIDYLQSIISGTTSADDVDMDKVIEIGEKDENNPLFNEALEVVLAAVDAESANL
jgi:hypothetical protein